jgi:4-hydroxythreonine-4-phosphate dehydrogenase
VVVRALAERPELAAVVFGDVGIVEQAAQGAGVPPPPRERIRPVTNLAPGEVVPGRPNEPAGRAQVAYLEAATRAVQRGELGALVTAPISKEWAARVGFAFPGHTEYLARAAGVAEYAMMLAGPELRVTLVTTHLALRDVPRVLSAAGIASAIFLTGRALRDGFGLGRPRVAVAGLNPHAGEAGQFGDEEARLITPAIAAARARLEEAGISCELSGPHVPDVVFRQAARGAFDAVVALYHDQGLIPVKMLHFDEAVNVTLGLPFIRTSPDHGTAYDIAGKWQARPHSFLAALDLADRLSRMTAGGSGDRKHGAREAG